MHSGMVVAHFCHRICIRRDPVRTETFKKWVSGMVGEGVVSCRKVRPDPSHFRRSPRPVKDNMQQTYCGELIRYLNSKISVLLSASVLNGRMTGLLGKLLVAFGVNEEVYNVIEDR